MYEPVQTKKLPGREYPAANEDGIASEMANELMEQLDRLYKDKKMLRQIHTKMHGCVKAVFTIEPGLPETLKAGVFSKQVSYHAWVRLSNASTNPKADRKKDVRGFAIKLMGVPGEKILNQEHLQLTQDFLLMNTETFFSRNVGEFRHLLAAATSPNKLKLLVYALNPAHWATLKRFSGSNMACSNPLELKYWSTQPYQFGKTDVAVKYFLRPSPDNKLVVENETDYDYLRINLAQTLYYNEAKFDFFVQFQTDPDTMPIEDPTVPWESEFIKVAALTIPAQSFDSKAQMDFGDSLSFNSWHALPEHRPLGSFNRVRKRIYEVLSKYRHDKNGLPVFEPQDSTDFLHDTHHTRMEHIDIPVPEKGVIKVSAAVLVNCDKETAFKFIESGDELTTWLKKFGPISPEKFVEIIKGPYSSVGAKRKVIFDNGDNLQEELISYNPYANYAYRASKFSNFLKHFTDAAYGQMWFDRVEDKTRITWAYSYSYKNIFGRMLLILFCMMFKKYMQHSLNNAKGQIENGDV
jgi:hypothetical protein